MRPRRDTGASQSSGRAARPRPRRGVTTFYAVSVLTAMVALCSLGADYGRVQLVKTELQRAADAAARAAAASFSQGVTAAQSAAVSYAGSNLADAQSVVVDPATDVDFGTWNATDRTFTVLAGANRTSANAIRVRVERTAARGNAVGLSFAALVGRPTCDVRASGVATLPPAFGLIGLTSVSISGACTTDSFNSVYGPYSTTNKGSKGSVGSNGSITLSSSGVINGNAHPGPGGSVTITGGAVVTGSQTPLSTPLSFPPPTLPGSYYNAGPVSVTSGTYYVAAGDYYCTSITVSNSATFLCMGPVRVFCSGPVNITGGYVSTYQNRPGNFQIFMLNSSPVTFGGQADFYGTVYAPQSAFTQSGTADIYGSVVANTLVFNGTWQGGVHFDESLVGSSTKVTSLVR